MVIDGLGWRHFTSRDVSVVRRNPDHNPDTGRLCNGFVPKEGVGTSGQKGHVVLSPWARKILDRKRTKIQEWISAQHQRRVAEKAYPFTLNWTDWTNNLVELSYQELTINHHLRLENQALFDIDKRAVPALTEFGLDEVKKPPIHPESHFPSKTFVVGLEPIKLTLFVKKSRKRFSI